MEDAANVGHVYLRREGPRRVRANSSFNVKKPKPGVNLHKIGPVMGRFRSERQPGF